MGSIGATVASNAAVQKITLKYKQSWVTKCCACVCVCELGGADWGGLLGGGEGVFSERAKQRVKIMSRHAKHKGCGVEVQTKNRAKKQGFSLKSATEIPGKLFSKLFRLSV